MWQAVELDPATYLNWTGYTACVKTRDVEVQVVRPPYPSGSLVRKGAEDTVHA